ncbi:hypothetical protein NL676_028005 [Syzygium grande]|nr:hypothetical protein NL676_028005 [Syzygium grande]
MYQRRSCCDVNEGASPLAYDSSHRTVSASIRNSRGSSSPCSWLSPSSESHHKVSLWNASAVRPRPARTLGGRAGIASIHVAGVNTRGLLFSPNSALEFFPQAGQNRNEFPYTRTRGNRSTLMRSPPSQDHRHLSHTMNSPKDQYSELELFVELDTEGHLDKQLEDFNINSSSEDSSQSHAGEDNNDSEDQMALAEAGLAVENVHMVEVVGSGSRVPAIIRILTEFFGKEPRRTMNASECVARGCALQCAILSPTFKVREFQVHESFPSSVGLSWKSSVPESQDGAAENHQTTIVFPKGNAMPSVKALTFYRSETFAVDVHYTDGGELQASSKISSYTIGPFQCAKSERAKLKVKVRLNLHGIVSIESATVSIARICI